jgi:hypothetical protein
VGNQHFSSERTCFISSSKIFSLSRIKCGTWINPRSTANDILNEKTILYHQAITMARHTNLADQDIAVISSNYGLELIRYQPVDGGDANSSFLLKAHEDDYVFTFYEK